MKQLSALLLLLPLAFIAWAQTDSSPIVEPGYETSFENIELLIIALVGLVLLIGLYFLFRRKNRRD